MRVPRRARIIARPLIIRVGSDEPALGPLPGAQGAEPPEALEF